MLTASTFIVFLRLAKKNLNFVGMEQLEQEAGELVDKLTRLALCLRRGEVTMEEYVCLKVLLMLNHGEFPAQYRIAP